jgi:hypothetical protein
VISGIEKNWEILNLVEIGITGLYRAIGYTREYFKNGKGSIIMDIVYKCMQHENEDVQVIATQCIVEIVRYNYQFIKDYMEGITDATFFQCGNSKSPLVVAQAIEVWTSIAEEETYRKDRGTDHHGLIFTIFNSLKDVVLRCLEEGDFNDDINDTEWGVSTSASCCIRNMAELM